MVASADKTVTMYDAKGNPIQYAAKERPVSGYMTIYKNVAPYESESIFIYDGGTIINQMMTAQKCAFYINSIGGLKGQENNAAEGGYEMVVSGVPGKVINSVPSGGNSLAILESSAHKDECWEFVKWIYTSNDGLAYFDYNSGYLACTKTVEATDLIQKKIAENANYANAYKYLENVNNNHRITGESDVATEIMTFMDAVFYDLEDVTEQWDIMEPAVNEKLLEANDK